MTKILNLGSLNLDHTYAVPHFLRPGETMAAQTMQEHLGGKGFNQTVALARAGAKVFHAGHVGPEGQVFLTELERVGADRSLVTQIPCATGHAVIQVTPDGGNCILVYGGANREITEAEVDGYLSRFAAGDVLLTQNETSCRDHAITEAAKRGLHVALNPSPITEELLQSPALDCVRWFLVNETEGAALTGEREPEAILARMRERFPRAAVLLTLGAEGCLYADGGKLLRQAVFPTDAVDTTAAGDTFTGFFLASLCGGAEPAEALRLASKAAAIAVSRPGAAESIPTLDEVCG